ncbi:MAG: WD40 repeat domain-containing protein [Anaerolineae bacterium]|nr:WD40 repeat domain-containing protein [Anaerolineae bacterium]
MTFHDYVTIESRLNETDIFTLIAECDAILAENPTEFMRLLRSALSLSAHVLEHDKTALASQLAGRLYHHYESNADVRLFVDSIIPPKNSLYPIRNGYDPLLPAGGMLVRIMKHGISLMGVKELSNGNILTWDRDNTLRIWRSDGRLINILTGHQEYIYSVIVLQNDTILSWDTYGLTRLWDSDGRLMKMLHEAQSKRVVGCIKGAIELTNGHILSWYHDSNVLQLWDENGEKLAELVGHTAFVSQAQSLPDGRILSWADDYTVRLWDGDGNLLKTLLGHKDAIAGVQILDDAIVSEDANNIFIWGLEGELVKSVAQKLLYQRYILLDGGIIHWNNRTISLYDETGHITLIERAGQVAGVLELADGYILSWHYDYSLRIWDKTGNLAHTWVAHTDKICHVMQLADGRIITCAVDGYSFIWDMNGHLSQTLPRHWGYPTAYQLSDGRLLTQASNRLYLWDIHQAPILPKTAYPDFVKRVIRLDNQTVLSADEHTVYLWDKKGEPHLDLWRYASWIEQDVILDTKRMMFVSGRFSKELDTIINFRHLTRRYPLCYGHEWTEDYKVRLPNGWQLAQGEHPVIYLEDVNNMVEEDDYDPTRYISELDEGYIGNYERIFAWLHEHGINPDDAYSKIDFPMLDGWRVSKNSNNTVIIYHPQTGKTIHTFYGDAPFTSVAVLDDVVIAGDTYGRVIFLRWIDDNPA